MLASRAWKKVDDDEWQQSKANVDACLVHWGNANMGGMPHLGVTRPNMQATPAYDPAIAEQLDSVFQHWGTTAKKVGGHVEREYDRLLTILRFHYVAQADVTTICKRQRISRTTYYRLLDLGQKIIFSLRDIQL